MSLETGSKAFHYTNQEARRRYRQKTVKRFEKKRKKRWWRSKKYKVIFRGVCEVLSLEESFDLLIDLTKGTDNPKAEWFYILVQKAYGMKTSEAAKDMLRKAWEYGYLEEEDLRQQLWYIYHKKVWTMDKRKRWMILYRNFRHHLFSLKLSKLVSGHNLLKEYGSTEEEIWEIPEIADNQFRIFLDDKRDIPLPLKYYCYLRYSLNYTTFTTYDILQQQGRTIRVWFKKLTDKLRSRQSNDDQVQNSE